MVHLNKLPPCLLVKILSYLPIGEVIRLKLVCKAWHEISAFVRFKSLSFYRYDYEGEHGRYFKKAERFPDKFDVYVKDFERFFKSTSAMIREVRRLTVCLYAHPVNCENNRLENFLHRFQMVEELDLRVLGFSSFNEEADPTLTLKLRRLRKLELRFEDWSVDLDCPELTYLDVAKLFPENCRIRYPEKLRTLSVDSESYHPADFERFVNLKNLVIDPYPYFLAPDSLHRTFWEELPKTLKRLIFFDRDLLREEYSNWLDLEDYLRESYAIDQEDPRLRIFYRGIELSLSRFIGEERDRLLSITSKKFEFLISNLANSVDPNIYFYKIEYNTVEKHLSTFDQLYKKMYPDPVSLRIDVSESVADQGRLLEFIEKVKPSSLTLEASFGPSFYKRLAEIVSPYIRGVHLNAANFEKSEPSALEFLTKITQLFSVSISNCPLTFTQSLDLMIAVFEKCKGLKYFDLYWEPSFSLFASYFRYNKLAIGVDFICTNGVKVQQMIDQNYFFEIDQNYFFETQKDVLRYLNVQLKQNSLRASNAKANELIRDHLQFFFLTQELKRQMKFNQFVSKVIVKYTKAIPIYL